MDGAEESEVTLAMHAPSRTGGGHSKQKAIEYLIVLFTLAGLVLPR